MDTDTVLKRFEQPDEIREFEKGRFEIVHIGGLTIGRATYQPGWKWSVHVGPGVGAEYCEVEHVGLVVSGHAVAAFADGTIVDLTPGTLFHIPSTPHDSWVVGDQPYISLHFLGADHYAARGPRLEYRGGRKVARPTVAAGSVPEVDFAEAVRQERDRRP